MNGLTPQPPVTGQKDEKQMGEYLIKVRKRGTRAFWFLSSGGGMNRLRIHAVRLTDKDHADRVVAEIERDNPEHEAKVVHHG